MDDEIREELDELRGRLDGVAFYLAMLFQPVMNQPFGDRRPDAFEVLGIQDDNLSTARLSGMEDLINIVQDAANHIAIFKDRH